MKNLILFAILTLVGLNAKAMDFEYSLDNPKEIDEATYFLNRKTMDAVQGAHWADGIRGEVAEYLFKKYVGNGKKKAKPGIYHLVVLGHKVTLIVLDANQGEGEYDDKECAKHNEGLNLFPKYTILFSIQGESEVYDAQCGNLVKSFTLLTPKKVKRNKNNRRNRNLLNGNNGSNNRAGNSGNRGEKDLGEKEKLAKADKAKRTIDWVAVGKGTLLTVSILAAGVGLYALATNLDGKASGMGNGNGAENSDWNGEESGDVTPTDDSAGNSEWPGEGG